MENKQLDPVQSLLHYLWWTEQFRRVDGRDEKHLFLGMQSFCSDYIKLDLSDYKRCLQWFCECKKTFNQSCLAIMGFVERSVFEFDHAGGRLVVKIHSQNSLQD